MDTLDRIVATLQAHEPELRAAGIRRLSLFGSAARGEERADSDIDVAVELDPEAHLGLQFFGLAPRLARVLGRPVDILAEPVQSPRLRANLDRDRRRVF